MYGGNRSPAPHLCPFRPPQVQGVHLGGRNEQIWGTSEQLQLRVEGSLLPLVNGYVWSTDITYIRVKNGFVYLMAVIDWYSRYVLSWRLSNTLDSGFCVAVLEEALARAKPQIFNTDQGVQFTSGAFLKPLKEAGVNISMDSKGRALDNIFVERLWRSLKYEEVYLKNYQTVKEARESLASYLHFYNNNRLHQSLGYLPPAEVYCTNVGCS